MTHYTKIEEFFEFLSDSPSKFQPFYHRLFNPDNILNGLPQNSHGSSLSQTLHKLLNSVMEPARELMVKAEEVLEFKQMTHEIDDMSTVFEFLKKQFLCEAERFNLSNIWDRVLLNTKGLTLNKQSNNNIN